MANDIEFIDPVSAQNNADNAPLSRSAKKVHKSKKIYPILVVILIFIAVLIPVSRRIFFSDNSRTNQISPTPTIISETSAPTPTPTPSVFKNELKISIENGTGIPREAAFLRTKLTDLGFENFELKNADAEDYKSVRIFYSDRVSEEIKTELETNLEKIYDDLSSPETVKDSEYDIRIITGTRPGVSKPTPAPTQSNSEATNSAITSTPTPSPTNTTTPTPTPS